MIFVSPWGRIPSLGWNPWIGRNFTCKDHWNCMSYNHRNTHPAGWMFYCIAKVGSNPPPRMPVTTRIIIYFLVRNPSLNLYFPLKGLQNWWTRQPYLEPNSVQLTQSSFSCIAPAASKMMPVDRRWKESTQAAWQRACYGACVANNLKKRLFTVLCGATCGFYSACCAIPGLGISWGRHVAVGFWLRQASLEAVSKQSSSLQSLRQKLQKARPCWGWTQGVSWLCETRWLIGRVARRRQVDFEPPEPKSSWPEGRQVLQVRTFLSFGYRSSPFSAIRRQMHGYPSIHPPNYLSSLVWNY